MDVKNGQNPQLNGVRRRQRVQEEIPENIPVVAKSQGSVPPELAHWIKLNAKELKIPQKERSRSAEVVNDFRENLLKFLKSEEPLFQSASFLTTGSYFEKVKIHSPDEFDMMLKVQLTTPLDMKKLDGGLYYRIDLARPTRSPIKSFLLENKLTISSSRILSEMHRLVRKFLNTYEVPDNCYRWEVNRKRLHSPAVTLSLCRTESNSISVDVVPALEVQGWPPAVRNGPDVDNWLGKKARQEIKSLPCYFVPKRLKGRKLSEDAKESWRISFSHIEKKIIMSHGNTKTCCESNANRCCRKQSFMLLKSLIEGLKQRFPEELDDLCSYHGKTVFLHTMSFRFNDSTWAPQKLAVCFLYLVSALEDHARRGILPHFFVPACNLFSTPYVPRKTLAFLVNALEEQKREGLPLLKPPGPAPPLRATMAAAETSSCKPTENSFQLTSVHYVILIVVLIVFVVGGSWLLVRA